MILFLVLCLCFCMLVAPHDIMSDTHVLKLKKEFPVFDPYTILFIFFLCDLCIHPCFF